LYTIKNEYDKLKKEEKRFENDLNLCQSLVRQKGVIRSKAARRAAWKKFTSELESERKLNSSSEEFADIDYSIF
jgi:hypothetical protein